MAQELMTIEMTAPAIAYNAEQLATIKKTIAAGINDAEFNLFIEVCKSTGLNPFAKQIYAIKRGDKLTIQTGIDGYRVMAERSGKYAGQLGPLWCGEDGDWRDVWLSATAPVACKVGVLRRDFSEPIWAVARTAAYSQPNNSLWKTMPDVMIAKCAEALALRKTFPEHISGVYTAEEMEQADNPTTSPYVEATPVPAQPAQRTDRVSLALKDKRVLDRLVRLQRFNDADRRAETESAMAAIEQAGGTVNMKTLLAELDARANGWGADKVTEATPATLEAIDMGAPGN